MAPRRQVAPGAALALALVACAAGTPRPADAPPAAPAELEVVRARRFDLFLEAGALAPPEQAALLGELERATDAAADWLGPGLNPGFLGPRGAALGPPELGPRPEVPRTPVVVLRRGARCFTDRTGITLVAGRLPYHDATHEVVHWLAGPSWRPLDEGLAVWLTERLWGPDRARLEVRARVWLELGHDARVGPDVRPEAMTRRDYDVAGAFTGWLVATYGRGRLLALYHGPPRDYEGALGCSEVELWRRFWQHLRGLPLRHDAEYHAFRRHVGLGP